MFINKAYYKCKDKKEAKFLSNALKELGYNQSTNYTEEYSWITNRFGSYNPLFEFVQFPNHCEIVDNLDLFLAIAAMTDQSLGIKGEWWYCERECGSGFKKGQLYKARQVKDDLADFSWNIGVVFDHIGEFFANNLKNNFRKATVEELKKHFMNKEANTLTRKQLVELHSLFTCAEWRTEIFELLQSKPMALDDYEFLISDELINKLKAKGSSAQIKAVEKMGINFKPTIIEGLKEDQLIWVKPLGSKNWERRYFKTYTNDPDRPYEYYNDGRTSSTAFSYYDTAEILTTKPNEEGKSYLKRDI